MGKTTPQTFDVDAWLDGLSRPQRSVRVYQRGDLMARLDDLAAQIEHADASDSAERSIADGASADALRMQYAELAAEMESASLTVTIQGHDVDEKAGILNGLKDASNRERGRALVFDGLVSPTMSREQFDRFMDGIGPAQQDRVAEAYALACNEIPSPSADFLPQHSTPDEGR